MHVVQHFFCSRQRALVHILPNFIVAGVAEETNTDHYITLKSQALLSFSKLFFEPCATAERYDFIPTNNNT